VYLGTALRYPNRMFSREPQGYYGLLTAGFLQGHLYAAIAPHPALLALRDPYDPVANAPYRVHDMTLWHGRYYLYFGAAPVLLFFAPVVMLTGYYPTEPFAVALFILGGVGAGAALLAAMRRRHYPHAPGWTLAAGVLCLGLANPIMLLTQAPQFYQVPISCAFLLLMLTLGAIYRALHAPPRTEWAWLASASLCFGLSVGARPNYVLSGFALCVPIGWLILRRRRPVAGLLAAGFGPAVLCGVALLLYNWQRFGAPLEFGMRYQLAGESFRDLKPVALANVPAHLREYLFNAGIWSRYFPFLSAPSGALQGMMRYTPWLWLLPLAFLSPRKKRAGAGRGAMLLTLGLVLTANLLLLASFFGMTNRYQGDFTPAWLILGGLGALAVGERLAGTPRWRLGAPAVVLAAVFSLGFSLMVFARGLGTEGAMLTIARAANWPVYAWERARGAQFGPLELSLELPAGRIGGAAEPLFQTGYEADQRDWLLINYVAKDRARIDFYHAGLGAVQGREFSVPADRRITVEAQCGSLMPPFAHPVFAGWSREQFEQANRDLRVKVNGVEVLRGVLECYPSGPRVLRIGELGWPSGGIANRFSGRVLEARRLPQGGFEAPPVALREHGPVELTLLFPADRAGGSDPLLVTGRGTQSDLLYCSYEAGNRVRFGLDHYGSGGPRSEAVAYDPTQPHALVIWMGSLADSSSGNPPPSDPAWNRRLVVLFDGQPVLNVEQGFYAAPLETAVIGFNAQKATTAGRQFGGRVLAAKPAEFSQLPSLRLNGEYGAVEMGVVFPLHVPGVADPLVVTGVTGKGDMLYVRYLDDKHVAFGFDHWGIGGKLSAPVELDYGPAHRLELTMGSLYPADSPAGLRTLFRVRLDGKTVLEGDSPCHPTSRENIRLGVNPIGGSTCGPTFNGKIISLARSAQPQP
jgi:hypothetical protein